MGDFIKISTLRFSEFNDEWLCEELRDIVKINQGLQIPISERLTTEVENSHFYITNEFLRAGSEKKYFIKNPPKSVLCNKEDILMTRTGNTGAVVTNVEGAFHNNFFKIAYPSHINKRFLYYFLILRKTQNQIIKLAGTSTIPDLNHSDFYKIRMAYPSLPEQQKIAAFLTAVDDKIQFLNKKKASLEQYKKGVMQQIFNQQIRFKDDDGKDYPDWEEKALGEVYSFKTTNSYSRENLNYENGVIKNIHYGDIHTRFQTLFDLDKEIVPYINSEIDTQKIATENYCIEGDLVIADASEDYDGVGKCIEVVRLNNQKVLAGLHTILARPNSKKVAIGFGGYLMQSENLRKQIKKIAQGSKVLSVSTGRLSKLSFLLPTLKEQTKIVALLSSIDDKTRFVNKQITLTQQYKKGLLQQMFV